MSSNGPGTWDDAPAAWVPTGSPAVRHRPWSTLLLAFQWVGVAVAAGLLVLGVVLVIQHVAVAGSLEDGQMYEPWGLVVAAVAGVTGVVLVAVLVPLLVVTTRARRRADTGQPQSLFGAAVASAGVAVVPVVISGLGGDPSSILVVGVLLAPFLAVAIRTAVLTRS